MSDGTFNLKHAGGFIISINVGKKLYYLRSASRSFFSGGVSRSLAYERRVLKNCSEPPEESHAALKSGSKSAKRTREKNNSLIRESIRAVSVRRSDEQQDVANFIRKWLSPPQR